MHPDRSHSLLQVGSPARRGRALFNDGRFESFMAAEDRASSIEKNLLTIRHSFRAYFIRLDGSECDPTIRVILVESADARAVYEAFGTWLQCRRWITQVSECAIFGDQLNVVRKRLELNCLATIKTVRASVVDLEFAGFRRADA